MFCDTQIEKIESIPPTAKYCSKICGRRFRSLGPPTMGKCTLCSFEGESIFLDGICLRCYGPPGPNDPPITKNGGKFPRPKAYWLAQDWGVKIVDNPSLPLYWGSRANMEVDTINPSGSIIRRNFRSLRYRTGKEDQKIPKKRWQGKVWGMLKVAEDNPKSWSSGTDQKISFICSCGQPCERPFRDVERGDISNCGCIAESRKNSKEFWFSQKYHRLRIIPESDSSHNASLQLPPVFSAGYRSGIKIEVQCDCGKVNLTHMADLLTDRTLSCGCALNETKSHASKEFFGFINSICPDAEYSNRSVIPPRELDVWVPSKKIAFEYHGAHWHSLARRSWNQRLKDHEKMLLLQELGVRLVQVYDYEWRERRTPMEGLIRQILGVPDSRRRIRPTFSISSFSCVSAFLKEYHYLGERQASGSLYIIANFGKKIVGAWVFVVEQKTLHWKRACWHPNYKAWCPHEKALKMAIAETKPNKVISFSDNRLHMGDLYRVLGFSLEKEIDPDYVYTNGTKIRHKFNFRVPAGIDEIRQAAANNWYRLYDSGKKRWVLNLP